jgi:hypothetical protein
MNGENIDIDYVFLSTLYKIHLLNKLNYRSVWTVDQAVPDRKSRYSESEVIRFHIRLCLMSKCLGRHHSHKNSKYSIQKRILINGY